MRGRIAFASQVQQLESECDFCLIERAQATAPSSAAVSEEMADTDTTPRCILSSIIRGRSRRTSWSCSGVSCRKALRGMWRFRDHRRGPCNHRSASLSSVVAPQNGLFPAFAHHSRLSFDVHGGRTATGRRASLGRGNCQSPWRDGPANGIVGFILGSGQTRRS